MQDFEGKVAVITGAASGIGRSMALRFGREGMKLALVDLDTEALERLAIELRETGVDVATFRTDVSSEEAMDVMASSVLERFGTAHVVCNNAGVATTGLTWDISVRDWDFVLGANIWGVIHGIRLFTPAMLEQNEGHIINTASTAGLVSSGRMASYNASKQAVVAISETLYADLEAEGSDVGCSVLCPGFVNTQIWDSDRLRSESDLAELASSDGEAKAVNDMLRHGIRDLLAISMSPDVVADRCLEAIREKTFYILTHEQTVPALQERVQQIVSGANPRQPSAGPENFIK